MLQNNFFTKFFDGKLSSPGGYKRYGNLLKTSAVGRLMIVLYFLFFSITLLYGIILPFFEEKSDFPFFYLKIPNNYIFSSIFLHIGIIFMLYLAIRFVLPYIIFVVLAGIKSVVLYIKNGN